MIIVTYELEDINQAKTLCSLLRGKAPSPNKTLNSLFFLTIIFMFLHTEPNKKRQQQTDTTAST